VLLGTIDCQHPNTFLLYQMQSDTYALTWSSVASSLQET
jgi:hypothetical protein